MPRSDATGPAAPIDFDQPDPRHLGAALRAQGVDDDRIAAWLTQAFERSDAAGYRVARALGETAATREQFAAEGGALFRAALTQAPARRREVLRGMLEAGRGGAGLFLMQQISALTQAQARACMTDFLGAGGQVTDVTRWLQLAGQVLRRHHVKASDTAGAVVDAVGDAAEWVVDALEDGVDAILEGIDAIIDALTSAGVAIVAAFEAAVGWTAEQMADLLAALVEAGVELGEFVAATFDWAYSAVRNFVAAALQVGFDALALLEQTVGQSYWVLRRFVDGLFGALGAVGDILDAVLTLVERGADIAWRSTLLALRFAGANLLDALDWVARQSQAVFTAFVEAWESIGEDLMTLYQWALTAGSLVWQMIGQATQTIGNSIYYVYNFLVTSGAQWIFDFTRGLLQAGIAVATLVAWAVGQAVEICGDVLRAAFEIGVTIGTALRAIATQPGAAWQTLVQAILQVGRTLTELMQAVLVETAQEFLAEAIDALLAIGRAVADILDATWQATQALFGVVVAELFNRLGSYRGLTAEERAEASATFGASLDYDNVFLSTEDPWNAIVFGVQDALSRNPDSRAFVTMNLINFDVGDGPIDRCTLIHELTHVWQSREVGGIYMAQALQAQAEAEAQDDDAYNYGYRIDAERITLAGGAATSFSVTLALPVTPDTLAVYVDDTALPGGVDDGAGQIVFSDGSGATGTIDYATGDVQIVFPVAPAADMVIRFRREVSLQLNRTGGPTPHEPEAFWLGVGSDDALAAAGGDFDAFNREQQGQIVMHWFARRFVEARGHSGALLRYDSAPLDPYQTAVASA